MSSLSSASTLAQVKDSYDDNASYAEDNSVTKARAFETACRILLRRLPKEAAQADSRIEINSTEIHAELNEVKSWLRVNDSSRQGVSVVGASFASFRG